MLEWATDGVCGYQIRWGSAFHSRQLDLKRDLVFDALALLKKQGPNGCSSYDVQSRRVFVCMIQNAAIQLYLPPHDEVMHVLVIVRENSSL